MWPKANDWYLYKKRRELGETQRHVQKEGSIKTEAQIGIIPSQTKEHLEPPEARKDSSLESSVRAWPF